MGLREDCRAALESIAAAVPDAVATMCHGSESGSVVQSSARDFAEPLSDETPAVAARYVANAGDFPTLEEGEAVEIGGSLRVVVSLKADAVGATFNVSLSAEFEKTPATYSGKRRESGSVRSLAFPLDILKTANGVASNFSDALAPSYAEAYTVAIRREDWPETTDPEPSDLIEIAPDGYALALKVSTVRRRDGLYILKCRTRG